MSDHDDKVKRPASQYYWGDWFKDLALQSCSLPARGLWHEMNCLMHQGVPYGHLTLPNGKAMGPGQLANLCKIPASMCKRLLAELEENGVPSVDPATGAYFSRRMVRDEQVRQARAEGGKAGAEHGAKGAEFGKLGGAPGKTTDYHEPGYLYAIQRASGGPIKVGVTKYVKQRLYALRKEHGLDLIVHCTVPVPDMADTETEVHKHFDGRREGEWITAPWPEVMQAIWGGNHPPSEPPPSSSSSSSATAEEKPPTGGSSAGKLPPCAHDLIVQAYHEVLPDLPRVRLMGEPRKRALQSFWRFVLTSKRSDGTTPRATNAEEALAWIREYFERAKENDFLMGRMPRTGPHANWVCDLDFLLSDKGKRHVIEKTGDNE